jgi:hypothetical protein
MPPDPADLKAKKVPWYHEKITDIDPTTRQLLPSCLPDPTPLTPIPQRDKAWQIYPYPCIGMFSFTRLHLISHPLYKSTIIPALLSGATLLDLGAGFSSDFRALVSAGVPSTQLTALDEHDGFWKLGIELFRDEETMKARFVVADMTSLASVPENMLGTFDMVWAGASFHLFGWDGQVQAGRVAARLLRDRRGSAVYGYQVGRTAGREISSGGSEVVDGGMYLHDSKTFERLWEEVGREAGMRFEAKTWMDDRGLDDLKKRDPEIRRLRFAVVRVDGPEAVDEGSVL